MMRALSPILVPEWTFDVQVEWLQEMINGLADPEFYLFRALIALSSQVLPDYYDDILSAYLASVWSQVFIQAPEHQPESQMNELKLFIQTCIDYYWPIFGTD